MEAHINKFKLRFKILLAVTVPVLAFVSSSGIAEAHVLKEDNGFSAVLHIDPDDEPVADDPSNLNFLMGNQNGTFSLVNYNLNLKISDGNGKLLKQAPVPPTNFGSAAGATLAYTFPKLDVYNLVLTGTTSDTNKQVFQMKYLVRVASGSGAAASASAKSGAGSEVMILSAGSLAIVGMVGYSNISSGRRYARRVVKPVVAGPGAAPKPEAAVAKISKAQKVTAKSRKRPTQKSNN